MIQVPFRSIFVPLDGSPFAEQALPFAVTIARASGSMVQLALVHHPVPALATALEVPEIEAQLDQEARQREQTYLDGVVDRLRREYNVPITAVLLEGGAAEVLQRQVESTSADLVVLTTHGRGALSRFWLGSVADQLMRRLHVPVLLIRPSGTGAPPVKLGKILVALDGSPFAERTLAGALALGGPFKAGYALLSVVEPPMPIADPSGLTVLPAAVASEERLRENAASYLAGVAERLRGEGLTVSTHVMSGPGVAGVILAATEELGADLVALASHGAGGFERLVVGSVADKVIRGGTHPVLVVRPALARG